MSRDTTCCFTGHRPHRLPWLEVDQDERCQHLRRELERQVELAYHQGYRHFISGMALGGDMLFCEAVLKEKKQHPEILLEAAIPFAGQADHWNATQQARYKNLLQQCDLETLVQQNYTRGCMMRRNQYMVDRSTKLIALFDGNPGGGTYNTLLYAIRQALDVVQLDPVDL